MIKFYPQSWVIVGVKQHDILTYRIARFVQFFLAPFLTQNLVLVLVPVDMKECGVLMTKMTKWHSS